MISERLKMANLETARKKLEEAQLEMIEAYLNRISQTYKSLSNIKRQSLMFDLERIVDHIESKDEENSNTHFNREDARIIRTGLKLSQRTLANELETSPQNISRYENGDSIPNSKTKVGRKYLEFLKKQGYNPYNI